MEKKLDNKGRWRNKLVGFRVSEEEAKRIDDCVALSGLSKQDYIIRKLECRDVVVQPNPRVYKALRNKMDEIYGELKRLEYGSEVNEELLYTIQLIAETMNGLQQKKEESQ
jgi:predicted secreted protein